MENLTAQHLEEIETLEAIYDTQWRLEDENFYSIDVAPNVKLYITFSPSYPATSAPKYELLAPIFTTQQKQKVATEFQTIYQANAGEPVIFQWIEKLKEIAENISKAHKIEPSIQQPAATNQAPLNFPIIHGQTIVDRKSTFQAHAAIVKSTDDTRDFLNCLLENKKISQATHNISAYRITTANNTILQDCDDDGETHAGGRVLHLLQILNVTNVMVVVSRWYGGIQLGPDRFKHINNAARQVLLEAGFISRQ